MRTTWGPCPMRPNCAAAMERPSSSSSSSASVSTHGTVERLRAELAHQRWPATIRMCLPMNATLEERHAPGAGKKAETGILALVEPMWTPGLPPPPNDVPSEIEVPVAPAEEAGPAPPEEQRPASATTMVPPPPHLGSAGQHEEVLLPEDKRFWWQREHEERLLQRGQPASRGQYRPCRQLPPRPPEPSGGRRPPPPKPQDPRQQAARGRGRPGPGRHQGKGRGGGNNGEAHLRGPLQPGMVHAHHQQQHCGNGLREVLQHMPLGGKVHIELDWQVGGTEQGNMAPPPPSVRQELPQPAPPPPSAEELPSYEARHPAPPLFGVKEDGTLRGKLYGLQYSRAVEAHRRLMKAEEEYARWLPVHQAIKKGKRRLRAVKVSHAAVNKRMRSKGAQPTAKWARTHPVEVVPSPDPEPPPPRPRSSAPPQLGPVWCLLCILTLLLAYMPAVRAMKGTVCLPMVWGIQLDSRQPVTSLGSRPSAAWRTYPPPDVRGRPRSQAPTGPQLCPTPYGEAATDSGFRVYSPPPPLDRRDKYQ